MNFTLNLSNWSYRDLSAFGQASIKGDFETLYSLARKLIVSWTYKAKLNGDDPFGELSLEDSSEVLRSISENIRQAIDAENTTPYKVSFKPWNTRTFMQFNEAARANNITAVQRYLREVVTIPNDDPAKDISAIDGALAMKAVQDAYAKVVSGKN